MTDEQRHLEELKRVDAIKRAFEDEGGQVIVTRNKHKDLVWMAEVADVTAYDKYVVNAITKARELRDVVHLNHQRRMLKEIE